MTRLILAALALLGWSELAPARAQFHGGPFGASGYSYSARGGFGFAVGGPNFRVQGFYGGFVTRSAFVAPPLVPVTPFGPFGPVGFVPAAPYPGYYGYYGYRGYGYGPPVVAVPVPIPVVVGNVDPNVVGAAAPAAVPAPKPPPGEFLVIAPQRNGVPELPRPADVRPGPVVMFDPVATPVKVEAPDADPKKEAARLLKLGRASFAAGEYGRAAEHFERAATADPGDALAYFLHGQAKFAAGQFAEAAARIREGLARDLKWPDSKFDPVALYGDKPERFFVHRLALKKAVDDNPAQATLEFLLGYQLWFSGEKEAADKLFRAAEKRLPEPGPIALFKLP